MATNGKYASLSCHTARSGITTFSGIERFSDGTTVQVAGAQAGDGAAIGDWRVKQHGKTIVHVDSTGAVDSHAGANPEAARRNAESIIRRTADVCKRGLDLRLIP